MDVKRKYNIFKYMFIVATVRIAGCCIYDVLKQADETPIMASEHLKNTDQIKNIYDDAGDEPVR